MFSSLVILLNVSLNVDAKPAVEARDESLRTQEKQQPEHKKIQNPKHIFRYKVPLRVGCSLKAMDIKPIKSFETLERKDQALFRRNTPKNTQSKYASDVIFTAPEGFEKPIVHSAQPHLEVIRNDFLKGGFSEREWVKIRGNIRR